MNPTEISIPSSKGGLEAVIHYPKVESDKLAILCAGYLDSKDYTGLMELARELTAIGYTTVRFDATGIWGSEGDIADYTTTQYIKDIKNVIDHMLKQKDHSHILLGGHSLGGMVSLLYASQDPKISIVLGIMPSSDTSMTPQRQNKWKNDGINVSSRDLPENRGQKREFKVPYSHVKDRAQYNVVEAVKNIAIPVLLFAGKEDELILPEDVNKIYQNTSEPKSYTIIPGVGHDYRLNSNEVEIVNQRILHDLQSYI